MKISVWLILCGVCWLVGMWQISFGQKPELVVQTGHTNSVQSVAFSSDGKTLASGSNDDTIKLWNVENGQEIRSLIGHTNQVYSVAFSPDGKTLASGGWDKTIRLWNVKTGQPIKFMEGHSHSVDSIAFSPDGKTLASGSSDKTVRLWNIETGRFIKSFDGHTNLVASIAFSPDGKMLVSESDKIIKLWDVETGQMIKSLEDRNGYVYSVAFSSDGKMLASGGSDNTVKLWNVETGQLTKSLKGHTHYVNSVAFSSDGKMLASGSDDYTVKLWNVETGQLIKSLERQSIESPDGFFGFVRSVAFSPNGKTLASANYDKTIKLWNVETGQLIKSLEGQTSFISSIAFSSDGKLLASGSHDKTIKLWNVDTGQQIKTLEGHTDWVDSVSFSPDGKTLASRGTDNTIKLWNIGTRQLIKSWEDYSHTELIAFSTDGKMFATGSEDDYTVKLWNVETGQLIKSLEGHTQLVASIAFSSDGKTLASGSDDDIIRLWNVETGQMIKSLKGHTGSVESIVFSSDGKILASGSYDKTIKLWNVETGQLIKSLEGTGYYISSVAFSSDGETLAAGSGEKTIKLWNVKTGQLIKSLEGHTALVWSVAFSSDGRTLASGSWDGTIKLWDKGSGKPLATLISFNKNDWLVTTPDGFFDGTPNAWKQLIWRFNNNTFDYAYVETYFNDFFYPNLLQDVLAGKSPKAPVGKELEKIDRRQPKVGIESVNGFNKSQLENQVSTDNRLAKVTVEATENLEKPKQMNHKKSSEIQDLRLFRNGSLVKIWHGETIDEIVQKNKTECKVKPAVNNSGRKLVCQAEIPIVAGENNLTAYGFNSANVKSNDDSVSIVGKFPKKYGTLYVLSIGLDKYVDAKYNLPFSVSGVTQINQEIKKYQDKLTDNEKLKQFARTEIITLTNENATKDNILLALKQFSETANTVFPNNLPEKLKSELSKIKRVEPEDALIIHFLGHGNSIGERFYFLANDFPAYPDADSYTKSTVSDIDLNLALEKIDAGQLLMIIDACRSGQAIGEEKEGRGPMNSKGLAQLAYDKGMLILTASQSFQNAAMVEGEIKNSLLAYALVEGFNNSPPMKDKTDNLSARDWLNYAVERVPILFKEVLKNSANSKTMGLSYLNDNDYIQTPRVFYRREMETNPLIISKAEFTNQAGKIITPPKNTTADSNFVRKQIIRTPHPTPNENLSNKPLPGKTPMTISGGVINGRAVNLPKPIYPAEAGAAQIKGTVEVEVSVDEAGNVTSAKAVSGSPQLLKACEEAALQAKFKILTLSGTPVKMTEVIVYNFVQE